MKPSDKDLGLDRPIARRDFLQGAAIGGEIVTRQEWLAVGIIVLGVTVLILGRR